ncbi:MAG: hypothetical protein ACK5JT_20920 [Hyphomicrobiaceae bacterium]
MMRHARTGPASWRPDGVFLVEPFQFVHFDARASQSGIFLAGIFLVGIFLDLHGMSIRKRLADAWTCETCRKHRQRVLVVAALLVLSWWLF